MPKHSENSPTSKWIEIADFEYLCFEVAQKLLTAEEPIPDYETRDHALLESALGSPKQTFGNKLLYPTLEKQAAILFYSLIKNHPFRNGNKRTAVMALMAFFAINNKWLDLKPLELVDVALDVSESKPENRDSILIKLEYLIKKNLEEY
jgi:death on curing protein